MKAIFFTLLALVWGWEFYQILPDLLSVKSKDVKVFDLTPFERSDGRFSPLVAYEGGEEILHKIAYNNPDKCVLKHGDLKGATLPLYRTPLLGKETLDPSLAMKNIFHLFLLIIATFFVMFRIS